MHASAAQRRFEYLYVSHRTIRRRWGKFWTWRLVPPDGAMTRILNELGDDGWELVGVETPFLASGGNLIFKRERAG